MALAGCAAAPRQTPPPEVVIPGFILTFRTAPTGGAAITCAAAAAADPVRGILEGDAGRSSQIVWLRGPDEAQITVAWPEGFSVRFEPEVVLYNERAQPVARQGQPVELVQVNVGDHAGTPRDPYLAVGPVFNGCYQPAF